MSICIFAGPTLPPRDAARTFDATWLPPAKHGDVLRAVSLLRPRAIGIVDGYFQWAPSVWHKEILWAIRQGVHVFGAASMGALRAAELSPFGMRGVGRIFQAYRSGVFTACGDEPFEDDDEVAVVHGPAESDYLAVSEAMVNIRYTLAEAARAHVIDGATHVTLVALAKAMYFADRSYDALLASTREQALNVASLAALQAWLPSGRVNLKRTDALAMLDAMREFLATDPPCARADFEFEYTTLWDSAVAALQPASAHAADAVDVLAELRLDGARLQALRQDVRRELLAPADDAAGAKASNTPSVDGPNLDLDELAKKAAAKRAADSIPPLVIEKRMLARLHGTGDYPTLLARALDKRRCMAAHSDLPPIGDFSEWQLLQLRDWYFSQRPGGDMPDDLEAYLRDAGFVDAAQFHAALFAEYVYRRQAAGVAEVTGETEAAAEQAKQ